MKNLIFISFLFFVGIAYADDPAPPAPAAQATQEVSLEQIQWELRELKRMQMDYYFKVSGVPTQMMKYGATLGLGTILFSWTLNMMAGPLPPIVNAFLWNGVMKFSVLLAVGGALIYPLFPDMSPEYLPKVPTTVDRPPSEQPPATEEKSSELATAAVDEMQLKGRAQEAERILESPVHDVLQEASQKPQTRQLIHRLYETAKKVSGDGKA